MESVSTSHNHTYDNFDARKYLDRFYGMFSETQEIYKDTKFMLKFLSNVFSSGHVKGHSLIELGSGPCIIFAASACEVFEKLYLTDYFQGNLDEIKKWLNSENDAFDWSPYLKCVCDLENNGSSPSGKEEKMRRMVSLMKSDVTISNPLHPSSLPLTDCVMVSNCLTCACKTFTDLTKIVKNIVSLLKPGGHLIINDYLGASYYWVGEEKLPLLSLDEQLVREAVVESGCKIEEFHMFKEFDIPEEVFDCKIAFSLLAQKL